MGSNDMPELGSRISLISKADIRYEGKLFTVDPQDCTIALANVRSFGTEDRETPHPVPAQAQVYDYILFRATDIKDISVIPTQQLIFDPAILQLSASPGVDSGRGFSNSGGGSSSGGGGFGQGLLGSMGGGGSGSGNQFNPLQSGLPSLAPRSHHHHHHHQQPASELAVASPPSAPVTNDLISGSRSSTPGLRRVSPSVDQGIQAELLSAPKDKPRNQHQFVSRQGKGGNQQQQLHNRNNQNRNRDNFQNLDYGRSWVREQTGHHYQNQSIWGYGVQGGYGNQVGSGGGGGGRWGSGGGGGGGGNRGGGGGGGPRGGGGQQQQQRNNNRTRNFSRAPGANKKPLKFDEDYDFDKANTEFEELRNELVKIKIGDAEVPPQNGETEKKEDSGNETGAGEGEPEEPEVFYDKTKSFFDNISCEAIERSKGRSQRTDWRKERKLNSETFGVAMTRRQGAYRGGRGGGGYYQQRGGGGWRGGSGAYRGYRQQNRPRNQLPNNLEVAKA